MLDTLVESCSFRSEYTTKFGTREFARVVVRCNGMRLQMVSAPVLKMSKTSFGDIDACTSSSAG